MGGHKSGGVEFVPKYLKIKSLLEAAVLGDLPKLRETLESGTGLISKLRGGDKNRPGLDSCDVRGMTALMYAVAYANKEIVEYLLSKDPYEQVKKEDNTKKTVLHHAAKRAKARKGNGKDNIDRIHQDI